MILSTFLQKKNQKIGGSVTSVDEKRQRALSLFIESVIKPDPQLRNDAYEQQCFDELMKIRDEILNYLRKLNN